MSHADVDHGFAGVRVAFVVFAVAPAAAEPRKGALHDPTFGQHLKSSAPARPRHEFDWEAQSAFDVLRQTFAAICRVRKDRSELLQLLLQSIKHQTSAVLVLLVGSMNRDRQHQPQCIDDQMPLASVDFLSAVVSALGPANLGGLHALAVDDRRARRRFAAGGLANGFSQRVADALPEPRLAPAVEDLINGLPQRKVARQHPPLTAGAIEVQNCIDDRAAIVNRRPASLRGLAKESLENLPLCVGEICKILRLPRLPHAFNRYGSFLGTGKQEPYLF